MVKAAEMTSDSVKLSTRAQNEIIHGRMLARQLDTETMWGWGTPAGKLRAERRAKLIVEGGALKAGVNALEIGCGSGNFTELFAETGANILAVDISSDLLEKARQRNLPADRVTFLEARFEDAKVKGPFDSIIGSSVLHHLEIEAAVKHIFDLLKPGGRFSFAEPNMLNPQVFLERRFHWLPAFSYVSPDETALVRWQFKKQLQRAGFTEIRLVPFDWLHPVTPKPLIRWARKVGSVLERLPAAREFAGSLHIVARRPA